MPRLRCGLRLDAVDRQRPAARSCKQGYRDQLDRNGILGVLALRYAWSLLKPGTLTVSSGGITQDLGWRRKHWNWADIDQVELRRTAANSVSVCMLYPIAKPPVRLFGWNVSADELYETIQRDRNRYSNSTMT
jgi:hypothetical protein